MKNLASYIFGLILILSTTSLSAQLLATINTSTEGGVVGQINTLAPQISLYQKGTDLSKQTLIFDKAVVTNTEDALTFTISSDTDDANFSKFTAALTHTNDPILRIGHKVNKMKTYIGRTVSDWVEGNTLEAQTIKYITITYTKVDFQSPGRNLTNDGNWTDFNYNVTLSFYGNEQINTQAE